MMSASFLSSGSVIFKESEFSFYILYPVFPLSSDCIGIFWCDKRLNFKISCLGDDMYRRYLGFMSSSFGHFQSRCLRCLPLFRSFTSDYFRFRRIHPLGCREECFYLSFHPVFFLVANVVTDERLNKCQKLEN